MTSVETFSNLSRELFWVLRKSLSFIILQWDKSDELTIDVAVNKDGPAREYQLCNYEIGLRSKGVTFPGAETLFEGDPTFTKLLIKSEEKYPLCVVRCVKNGDSCTIVNEKVCFISASDHQIFQSLLDRNYSPEVSTLVLKITCCSKDVTNSIDFIKSYLHCLKVCYQPRLSANLSFVEDAEKDVTEFDFVCDDFAAYVNKTVLTCVSSCDDECLPAAIKHSSFIPLKMPSSFESVKVRLTAATSCGPAKGTCGILCIYLFGPFGLPITNENDDGATCAERLVDWEDYGVALNENINISQFPGLLSPYLSKKLLFLKMNAFDLTMFLVFDAIDKPSALQEKVDLSDKVQRNIEEIMTLNMEATQRSCSQALEQTMFQSKETARKRCNEIATVTTVSSIFDIVTHSTNNEFRDACLSLLNSATTHGFRGDLYEVLSEYTKTKLENKRHKRRLEEDADDLEWKLLEENTQTL